MSDRYILKGREVFPCDDLKEWAKSFEISNRQVARETIGNSDVSTVFLGLDHSYNGGPPMLFETLVFGGPLADEMARCTTYEEAEAMHKVMCERVLGHTDFSI